MKEIDETSMELLKLALNTEFSALVFSFPVDAPSPMETPPRLIWVIHGPAELTLGRLGKKTPVAIPENGLVIALPGAPSSTSHEQQNCETFAVALRDECTRLAHYAIGKADGAALLHHVHIRTPLPAPARQLTDLLCRFSGERGLTDACMFSAKALLSIVLKTAKFEDIEERGKAVRTWERIEAYVRKNPADDLSRKQLAQHFGVNPSYLSILCRKRTGLGFNEFVLNSRLEEAVSLLELNLPLAKIALRCGFHFTNYFIRCFKSRYGVSPGKFR